MSDFPNERPPLGKVEVGDTVYVMPPRYGSPRRGAIVARVVKIGRIWLTVSGVPHGEWRMHRDTQYETAGPNPRGAHFLTLTQSEWRERLNDADTFLRKQGIMTSFSEHGWQKPSGRVRLADLIKADLAREVDAS